jgi:hypothetical protein
MQIAREAGRSSQRPKGAAKRYQSRNHPAVIFAPSFHAAPVPAFLTNSLRTIYSRLTPHVVQCIERRNKEGAPKGDYVNPGSFRSAVRPAFPSLSGGFVARNREVYSGSPTGSMELDSVRRAQSHGGRRTFGDSGTGNHRPRGRRLAEIFRQARRSGMGLLKMLCEFRQGIIRISLGHLEARA